MKQMNLYLAPAIFCYLLAGCLDKCGARAKISALAPLALVTISTCALCWLPFLGDWDACRAVLVRIFPLERHLYEDKVANLWCTLSPLLKLKQRLSIDALVRLALGTTAAAIMPQCALLLRRPSRLAFLLASASSALAFFLCSFQACQKGAGKRGGVKKGGVKKGGVKRAGNRGGVKGAGTMGGVKRAGNGIWSVYTRLSTSMHTQKCTCQLSTHVPLPPRAVSSPSPRHPPPPPPPPAP